MPAWDEPAVAAAAGRLRLAIDARRRLGAGQRLGTGAGASLEFHDHRAYQPGDDLRHLDWGVLGRTDQLVLRRYRREASPRLELLVDGSLSQGHPPAKLALTCALADLLASLAEAEGLHPVVWWLGTEALSLGRGWRAALRAAPAGGTAGPDRRLTLAAGSDRVLLSDGLCPAGGPAIVRHLGAGAGRLALVEVLTRQEWQPTAAGPVRLEDVEGGAVDHVLEPAVLAARQERFVRHRQGWAAALAGRGPGVVPIVVDDGFPAAVAALVKGGLVTPRGSG